MYKLVSLQTDAYEPMVVRSGMDWQTAYHIAGEICDLIGNVSAKDHERIASIIQDSCTKRFNSYTQRLED